MRVSVFAIVFAIAIAGLALAPSTAADEPCPSPTYAIFDMQGALLSCEAEIGAPPEGCPDWAVPGYLASGELAGCFEADMSASEEVCDPNGADTDGDGLPDSCDLCPNDADCDGDGWGDGIELYVGTDALDACPDDADDAAWPLDMNNDTWSDILDVLLYRGHLGCQVGDSCYDRRLDLNADEWVDILDVLLYRGNLLVQCSDEMGAGVSQLGAGVPELEVGANIERYWLPLDQRIVRQHSTNQWCWWFAGKWWCEDKYWVHLDQAFYYCELGAVTVGPHTVSYGAEYPFVKGDTWYRYTWYSATHVRALAGMDVGWQRGEEWETFEAETWINYYFAMPYSVGDRGFLVKGPLDPDDIQGHYSYKGGANCTSEDDQVDPVSVVFYGGDYIDVEAHACDHGSWCFHSGSPQMFWSYGCWEQDGQANSASPAWTQFHMRILTGRYWDGTYANDPVWGRYNLATPHHEEYIPWQPGCGTSMHSVDDDESANGSGFVMARRDIVDNWVVNGPHIWGGYQNWGNTKSIRQSAGKGLLEGCWYASNDGLVAFISLEHE